MKTKTIILLALIAAFAASPPALAEPGRPQRLSPGHGLDGLSASDWAGIRQQAYLKASNAEGSDQFAHAVSVSGDTVVVGADWEDSNATGINGNQSNESAPDSGAAYVFVRNGTNWTQQAYLKASNTSAGDRFGYAVAVSGDVIVVGSIFESSSATGVNGDQSDNSAMNSGAAYVFVRSGTNWSQQAYLKASNTGASDLFGDEVAVSGDTIVVSAFQEDSNATGVNGDQGNNSAENSGAAYVFVRDDAMWTQQAYLKASNTGAGDAFYKVAVSGDTVVIGAIREDSNATGINGDQSNNSATDSGAAYVFVRSGTTWVQQAYLKGSNTETGDRFGFVVISGDTIMAGAFREDSDATGVNGDQSNNSALDSGAAYVFVRTGTDWTQQAYLKPSNTAADDRFGWAVSLSGDTVVVGAHQEDSSANGVNGNQSDNGAANSGAAYVFVRRGTNWSQQAYLKAHNTEADDNFGGGPNLSPGTSVAVSGDTVVIGASFEDSNATGVNGDGSNNSAANSGAAYVFAGLGVAELHVPTDYATIQEAVNVAAVGDTIRIAAGDYFEQVIITDKTGLTLAGAPGAVLHATTGLIPTLLPYGSESIALLGIAISDVLITGLTFDGENMADHFGTFTGIDYVGSSGRVENCAVRRFRRSALAGFTSFNVRGVNVWNGVSLGTPAVNVSVFNSTFDDNETSILLSGDDEFNPTLLRTTFVIEGNTVTGFGPVAMAVDGIVIFNGAGGDVRRNTMRNHVYTGTAHAFSGGLGAFDGRFRFEVPLQPVCYEGNTFSNNTVHLALIAANESQVRNNVFQETWPGFFPWSVGLSGANILVANNDFSGMATGMALFGGETYPEGGSATNPKLIANWFCNVPVPIHIEPLVTGLEEQGTKLCDNGSFRPEFQSLTPRGGGGTALAVRSWHGAPVIIEASANLQDWLPVHTNLMTLPTFAYEDAGAAAMLHRFYRAVRP